MAEPVEFKFTIPEDRTEVEIVVPKTTFVLSAEAIDELTKALAQVRAGLNPPAKADYALGQICDPVRDPKWLTEPDVMGADSLLHIRHPGLGWLHFLFPKPEAAKLAGFLQAQVEIRPEQSSGPKH